ncbi:MFS transporter [Streptomyces sp. NPDC046994]|uniref:MFS transporter n=1 Tax=Streptomyces sp. NPDC046994 TaxID=3155735 RepID=UPI0034541C03
MSEPIRRSFGALAEPRFRLLWLGQAVSQFGSATAPIAVTLAITRSTGSALSLSTVLGTAAVVQLLLLIPAGVWVDRLPRHVVLAAADLVNAAVQCVVAVELLAGTVDVAHLTVASAISAAALAFQQPALQGVIPAALAPDRLQQANALMGLTKRVTMVVGPGLATTLVLTAGAGAAVLVDAASFLISAAFSLRLRLPHRVHARRDFFTDLRTGWSEVRSRRWYWTNLIGHCVWNMGRCVYFTVGATVVVGSLGGQLAWGTVLQGGAVGALAGVMVAVRLRPRRPLVVSNLCLALGGLPLLLIAAHAPVVLIAVSAGFMYSALGLSGTLWETTVQQRIPADRISRVLAYDWFSSLLLNPVSLLAAGPLALAIGEGVTLVSAGVLTLLCCLGLALLPDVQDASGHTSDAGLPVAVPMEKG